FVELVHDCRRQLTRGIDHPLRRAEPSVARIIRACDARSVHLPAATGHPAAFSLVASYQRLRNRTACMPSPSQSLHVGWQLPILTTNVHPSSSAAMVAAASCCMSGMTWE